MRLFNFNTSIFSPSLVTKTRKIIQFIKVPLSKHHCIDCTVPIKSSQALSFIIVVHSNLENYYPSAVWFAWNGSNILLRTLLRIYYVITNHKTVTKSRLSFSRRERTRCEFHHRLMRLTSDQPRSSTCLSWPLRRMPRSTPPTNGLPSSTNTSLTDCLHHQHLIHKPLLVVVAQPHVLDLLFTI